MRGRHEEGFYFLLHETHYVSLRRNKMITNIETLLARLRRYDVGILILICSQCIDSNLNSKCQRDCLRGAIECVKPESRLRDIYALN